MLSEGHGLTDYFDFAFELRIVLVLVNDLEPHTMRANAQGRGPEGRKQAIAVFKIEPVRGGHLLGGIKVALMVADGVA